MHKRYINYSRHNHFQDKDTPEVWNWILIIIRWNNSLKKWLIKPFSYTVFYKLEDLTTWCILYCIMPNVFGNPIDICFLLQIDYFLCADCWKNYLKVEVKTYLKSTLGVSSPENPILIVSLPLSIIIMRLSLFISLYSSFAFNLFFFGCSSIFNEKVIFKY